MVSVVGVFGDLYKIGEGNDAVARRLVDESKATVPPV